MDFHWPSDRPGLQNSTPLQIDRSRSLPYYDHQFPGLQQRAHPYHQGPLGGTFQQQLHHHYRAPSHIQYGQVHTVSHQQGQPLYYPSVGSTLSNHTMPLVAHPVGPLPTLRPHSVSDSGMFGGPVGPSDGSSKLGRKKGYAAPPGVWKNSGGYVSTVYVNKRRFYGPLRRTVTEATEDRRRLLRAKSNHATEAEVRDLIHSMRESLKSKTSSSQTHQACDLSMGDITPYVTNHPQSRMHTWDLPGVNCHQSLPRVIDNGNNHLPTFHQSRPLGSVSQPSDFPRSSQYGSVFFETGVDDGQPSTFVGAAGHNGFWQSSAQHHSSLIPGKYNFY